jgi:hypothetical protein
MINLPNLELEDQPAKLRKKPVAPPTPETITVRVIAPAKNPRYVYGALNGTKITIEVPRKLSHKLVGKPVTVRVIPEPDTTRYVYER